MLKKLFITILALNITIWADNLKIAAGAGYKQALMEIINDYEKNNNKIDAFFGNMKQVTAQAKQTNISLIIGDKRFLKDKTNLDFKKFSTLGKGKLVIAFPKDTKINTIEDLLDPKIKKISIPQAKKAIYGIAGEEFLQNTNLYEKLESKLLKVATVPHAMTYVIANEVDAAIVNLTAALANKNNIGGYLEVPEENYSSIQIVVGELNYCKNNNECEKFFKFLLSPRSKKIFEKYGL